MAAILTHLEEGFAAFKLQDLLPFVDCLINLISSLQEE